MIKINKINQLHIPELIIAILPIMRYFRSPIGSYNMGTIMLYFLLLYSLITIHTICFKKNYALVLFLLYTIISFFIMGIGNEGKNIGSGGLILELFIYTIAVFVLVNSNKFSIDVFLNIITVVSVISTCVLVIQYVLYLGIGRWFQPFSMSMYTYNIQSSFSAVTRITTGTASGMFRPSSIFIEPAHFAQYVSIAFVISLYKFYVSKEFKQLLLAIIFSVVILMSTSAVGFLVLVAIWLLFLFCEIRNNKSRNQMLMFVVGILFLCIFANYMSQQSFVQLIVRRLFSTDNTSTANAIMGRSGGYLYFSNLDWFSQIFGIGYGREIFADVYFTFFSATLVRVGIIGTMLYIISLICTTLKQGTLKLWMLIVVLIIEASADVHDYNNLIFFTVLMFANYSSISFYNEI